MLCKEPTCGRDEKVLRQGYCVRCYGRFRRNGTTDLKTITNQQKGILNCQVEGCGKVGKLTKGLCKVHYYRRWRTGKLDYTPRVRSVCSVDGCDKFVKSKGLCDTHRKRVARKGGIEAGARPEGWGDYDASRQRARKNRIAVLYGTTVEHIDKMEEDQGGVCAISGLPEEVVDVRTGKPRALAIDHDEVTQTIRGRLRGVINLGLGCFDHRIDWLCNAILYLAPHSANMKEELESCIQKLQQFLEKNK